MKNFLLVLLSGLFLLSCDDGDLIVTNFDFEDQDLQYCQGNNHNQVFFKLNNQQTNEAIALIFRLESASDNLLLDEVGILEIPISAQNQIIYRTFNSDVSSDYFCNVVPPTSPEVIEEYRSTSGGEIVLTSTLRNADDHDQDGVPSIEEGMEDGQDSDEDRIPDYLDIDDDNDNVLTSTEIAVEADSTAMGYPDTDGDNVPNYLDTDDDNDETDTRNEVENENQFPDRNTNDQGVPDYINPEVNDFLEVSEDIRRTNTISSGYRYFISIENLTLVRQGGDGEQIRMDTYEFGFYDSPLESITYPLEEE